LATSSGCDIYDTAQGHGIVTTKDGSEKANYTFLQVGKTITKDGKPVLRGVFLHCICSGFA